MRYALLAALLAGCADGVGVQEAAIDVRSPMTVHGTTGLVRYAWSHNEDYQVVCRPTCDAELTVLGEFGSVQYLQAGVMRVFSVPGPAEEATIRWITPGEIRIFQTTEPRQAGGAPRCAR